MMKSFFKKLAFVMALAMVVSMAAPAGSALAAGLSVAYQAGGAVSELNLKAGAEQDLKFLGAPKNWKDLGWSWTSSNEAVATVDAAGVVTAVADGTATITITVGSLSGSVTVNVGDAKAYDVTLGNADNKAMTALELKKDGKFDFNFYGVKDWNKNNYTVAWSVSGDAANVDKNGVVTAVKSGKAVVTASIVNNVTGVAHKVTPVEVTVAADVNKDAFTVAQKDTDKFVLTFNEAKTADQIKDGLTVSVKIGEQNFPISFENITVDGKDVTVTTYAQFENDEVYTLAYGKETVAYTIVLGDIAEVRADYYTGKNKDNKVAYVTEEEENDYVTFVPVLYDQYGNNITDKYDVANFDFVYEVSDNVAPVCIYNDVYAFDKNGVATVDVTATWFTDAGELKTATGKTTFVVEKRGKIALTLERAGILPSNWMSDDDLFVYEPSKLNDWKMDPNSTLWTTAWTTTTLPYFDGGIWDGDVTDWRSPLYYGAVFKDNRGNLVSTNNDGYEFGTFSYESTNTEVIDIAADGEVTRNKAGKANILVYFTPADGTNTRKLVTSTPVVLTPQPYAVSYKMINTSQTTASHVLEDGFNDAAFFVQFTDQTGAVYTQYNSVIKDLIKVEARDNSNKVEPKYSISWDGGKSAYKIVIDADEFVANGSFGSNTYKSYSYKVTVEDHDLTDKVNTNSAFFSLTIKDTEEERDILRNFIDSTAYTVGEDGKLIEGEIGDYAGEVPSNYKFNIAYGGNQNVDVAVKHVIGYQNVDQGNYYESLIKSDWFTKIGATYLSTGNLALGNVPAELLVDNTEAKAKTGHVGYVYYKVTAPSKTSVAGASVSNDDLYNYWSENGGVKFTFNATDVTKTATTHFLKDEAGKKYPVYMNEGKKVLSWAEPDSFYMVDGASNHSVYTIPNASDANGWTRPLGWDALTAADAKFYVAGDKLVTYAGTETLPVDYDFMYAGTGTYSVAFSTTRQEGKNLSTAKTSSLAVTNSQSQVKFLGLNPELNGVTENINIVAKDDSDYRTVMQELIEEQLLFSYEEIFLGDFYADEEFLGDGWQVCASDISIDFADPNTKITVSKDAESVTISSLVFKVTLDDGNDDTTCTYKMKVNVGVRIKEK